MDLTIVRGKWKWIGRKLRKYSNSKQYNQAVIKITTQGYRDSGRAAKTDVF